MELRTLTRKEFSGYFVGREFVGASNFPISDFRQQTVDVAGDKDG